MSVNISDLKTGKQTNVDGKELRDFGDGKVEFDPTANGFECEKEEVALPDKDKALAAFDKQMQQRVEEMNTYNELLDMHGGEISEEELREELGQDVVTQQLHDGAGDKYEENGSTPKRSVHAKADNTIKPQISENDELEAELEEDDSVVTIASSQLKVTAKTTVSPIEEKTPPAVPSPIVSGVTAEPKKAAAADDDNMSDEDKDLAALDDDATAPPVDDFETKLKAELERKMRPVTKKFDLSHAVISSKPITVNNAMGNVISLDKRVFTWGLLRSKRPITVRAFTATELNALDGYMRNKSSAREVFKSIWEHIAGAGKGSGFDSWLKCTSYFDVDHIWFAVYGACFQDANYLPFNCPKCGELTVTDNIPVERMCKFTKPEYKDELEKVIAMPAEPNMGNVFAEYLVQISDNIAIGFREPSIYDAVVAPTLYDDEFKRKYNDTVGLSAYIGNIYHIGEQNGQVELRPIMVKEFPGNEVKTMKARVIQYAKIIRALPSDQYNIILSHISSMTEEENITYGLPAATCDHCHNELDEERDAAADLVFMRHRLATLGA